MVGSSGGICLLLFIEGHAVSCVNGRLFMRKGDKGLRLHVILDFNFRMNPHPG